MPSIGDTIRLPDLATATETYTQAERHVKNLEVRLKLEPSWKHEAFYVLCDDARRRSTFWRIVKQTQQLSRQHSERAIRENLNELKNMLGVHRYYSGDWPDPVPLDYYTSID